MIIPWWPDFALFIAAEFIISAAISYLAIRLTGRFL